MKSVTTPKTFRLTEDVIEILLRIHEKTRLSPAIIVSDGIKLVAERELGKRKRVSK